LTNGIFSKTLHDSTLFNVFNYIQMNTIVQFLEGVGGRGWGGGSGGLELESNTV
jgi:hypothetical protein